MKPTALAAAEPPSEATLVSVILIACKRLGLLVHHDHYSGHVSEPGFPDLLIAGPRGYWLWEIKSDACPTLSPAQQRWADMAKAAGMHYSVVTPKHWARGILPSRLRAIADEDEAGELPWAA